MGVLTELTKHQSSVLLLPPLDYTAQTIKILKKLEGKSVCYVTLNKTYKALKEQFEDEGLDLANIVFIDAITKTFREVKDLEACYFVSSPAALTELAITVEKFVKHGFDYLIFDSLTNLLIYHPPRQVVKFVSTLTNLIHDTQTSLIYFAISLPEHETTIKECCMSVEHTVDMRKGAKKRA